MIKAESRPGEKLAIFPCPSLPTITKEGDMKKPAQKADALLSLIAAGWRRLSMTKVFFILGEIFLITCLTGALAQAHSKTTQPKKGNDPMQQAATVAVKDVPPLDRSVPSRVETFTLGLG
jgi:hypothetical protein